MHSHFQSHVSIPISAVFRTIGNNKLFLKNFFSTKHKFKFHTDFSSNISDQKRTTPHIFWNVFLFFFLKTENFWPENKTFSMITVMLMLWMIYGVVYIYIYILQTTSTSHIEIKCITDNKVFVVCGAFYVWFHVDPTSEICRSVIYIEMYVHSYIYC